MSAGNQAIPNIVTLCKGERKHLVIKILSLCCSPQVKCVVEGINNIVGLTEHTCDQRMSRQDIMLVWSSMMNQFPLK